MERDYQINAILYSDNVLNYGNAKYLPEILTAINEKVPISIDDLWIEITKPYILTLKIKIDQIKICTFDDGSEFDIYNFTNDDKYKYFLSKTIKYIYNCKNSITVSDKYIFLNDNTDITSDCIVNIKEASRERVFRI